MNNKLFILFSLLSLWAASTVFSQVDTVTTKELPEEIKSVIEKYSQEAPIEDTTVKEKDISLELDGLIINETISKAGNDFYNQFRENWNIPKEINEFTIYIMERPMPGMGNLITIKINYKEIFQNRISPRIEQIEQLADYAVNLSEQHLMKQQEISEELEEDMSGTGIY